MTHDGTTMGTLAALSVGSGWHTLAPPWAPSQNLRWASYATLWHHHKHLGNNIGGQWVAHIGTTMSSLAASSVGNVWHMLAPPWVVDGTSQKHHGQATAPSMDNVQHESRQDTKVNFLHFMLDIPLGFYQFVAKQHSYLTTKIGKIGFGSHNSSLGFQYRNIRVWLG